GAHVVCVLPDTEGEHLQVGLNLLDAGPRLGIGVKRDGDARQHAEDRPHDYELGARDSALGTRCALLRPATSHLHVSSGYPRSRGSLTRVQSPPLVVAPTGFEPPVTPLLHPSVRRRSIRRRTKAGV